MTNQINVKKVGEMADKSLEQGGDNLDATIYDHKWGYTDTRFVIQADRSVRVTGNRYALSGTEMPDLLDFVEDTLEIKLDFDNIKQEVAEKPVPAVNKNEPFCAAVAAAFPESRYSFDPRDRLIHSHGQTTMDEVYRVLYGRLSRVADMVFYLEGEEDAAKLIQLAAEHNVCLVPYGGGTSVSCALVLPAHETRMIVVVDTRRMNKVIWIDEENMLACVQAGITGSQLEAELGEQGFVAGHEPDSMELSTLGGWIATNASGMKKNRYGNIEQIVQNVTMVTPTGVIEHLDTVPRSSIGMQPKQLLFGSEGNLGLITKAVIAIHKKPEVTKFGSIVFPTFKHGVDFLYALTQTGVLPASIRLLDNIQFRFGSALKPRPTKSEELMGKVQKFALLKVKGFDPYELAAATVVMEGTKHEVAYQNKVIFDLAKRFGGIAGGEGNGRRGYMLTYAIAYIRDFLADYHIIGETYETTVPWSKVHQVIDAVDKRARELHEVHQLPGRPYMSPRVTQLYHTGVCIYFTHGFSVQGVAEPDKLFGEIERELRRTILDAGGSLSHHHGIGKLRQEFMPRALSAAGIELLRSVKAANDPQNIFGVGNNVFAGE
ncbi:MAG: FAD-binding oxidoreductase [Ardenticatenaceae bacterium]|nr:FAD-binding oxidoreductase [Ardenticatenaceae bacterium]